MDYEKAYKEALERARALWREAIEKEYVNDYLKDYETIFPELRESEDERIRKEIIDIVEAYRDNCVHEGTHRFDDCLAYLKKQEQKPADVDESTKRLNENWMKQYFDEPKPAWSEELDIDTLREWSMRYAPDIRQAIESTAYHFYNIRPHWKPSEEQMEALRTAVHKLAKTDVADSVRLSIMYDNLKKL